MYSQKKICHVLHESHLDKEPLIFSACISLLFLSFYDYNKILCHLSSYQKAFYILSCISIITHDIGLLLCGRTVRNAKSRVRRNNGKGLVLISRTYAIPKWDGAWCSEE